MLWLNSLLVFLRAVPLGLGIGGGGLFLLYLGDVLGLARDTSVYLNLIFFLSALVASAFGHLRTRRLSLSMLGIILLFGVPGTFLGRWGASLFSSRLLHLFLGFFLLGSGIFTLFSLKKAKKEKERPNALDKR